MKSALLLPIALLLLAACSGPVPDAIPQTAPVATTPAEDKPVRTIVSITDALPAVGLKTEAATTIPQGDGSLLYRNSALGFRLRIPVELKDSVYVRDAVYADNPEAHTLPAELPPVRTVLFYIVDGAMPARTARAGTEFEKTLRILQIPLPWQDIASDRVTKAYQVVCTDPHSEQILVESGRYSPYWDAQGSVCNFDIAELPWGYTSDAMYALLASFHTDTDPASDKPITYRNKEYGFELTIPNTWSDYRVHVGRGKSDGKYPPGATFRFYTRQTDAMAAKFWGGLDEEDGWTLIYINCTDSKEWYDPDTEESYYPKEGENKKCVFTMNITNGALINTLVAARMYTILHSFRAIPVP